MYILETYSWFETLMRKFFYNIDKVIFNFIPTIYNFMLDLARTTFLTQTDIADMADRIYKLLAVFMVFKVTFSLIMYVVNPDDFTDKDKGIGKIGTNICISLALLILTPYIFSYAYKLQTLILEDNSLATLVFGTTGGSENSDGESETTTDTETLNNAGEEMAYIIMAPFFTPDTSIEDLYNCAQLTIVKEFTDDEGNTYKKSVMNPDCSGLDSETYESLSQGDSLAYLATKEDDDDFDLTMLQNYVAGFDKKSIGLMFRKDMAVATAEVTYYEDGEKSTQEVYVMDYKNILSTVVGVVTLLLLISFCMDVALRCVKLAFLQLIAPIPIISYIDPKSGKDGLFKKWYQMCFKTYASLFLRLLSLYFAIYIISRVDNLTDIIDGSYKSSLILKIFVVIGTLMFAKQLPKILEGLGIKLDGDGKFSLNPLRKMENEMLGGQHLKKPIDALMKAPGSMASLTGRKILAGIDGAKNGDGFFRGTANAKSKTAQKLEDFRNKNMPNSARIAKEKKEGHLAIAANRQMLEDGEKYKKIQDELKANGKSESGIFSSSEYRNSYDNVAKQKENKYAWDREVEKRRAKLNAEETRLAQMDSTDLKYAEQKAKTEAARGAMDKALEQQGKAHSAYDVAQKNHDEMKKIHREDAKIEDSIDFYNKTNANYIVDSSSSEPETATPDTSSEPETETPDTSSGPETGTPDTSSGPETGTPDTSSEPETGTPDTSSGPETGTPDTSSDSSSENVDRIKQIYERISYLENEYAKEQRRGSSADVSKMNSYLNEINRLKAELRALQS